MLEHACVLWGETLLCGAMCMCTMCGMCWYDFDTHLDIAVSSLFTLQNTATATIPAMAPVNRTPPMKPPTAAPTPVLKQPTLYMASKVYTYNYRKTLI